MEPIYFSGLMGAVFIQIRNNLDRYADQKNHSGVVKVQNSALCILSLVISSSGEKKKKGCLPDVY